MKNHLRIGTRGSQLALVQTELFIRRLKQSYPGADTEIIKIRTKGDDVRDRRLDPDYYKGYFTHELEQALLANEIDAAVHSLKDMPVKGADGLVLACFLKREAINDCLVLSKGKDTKSQITVGTGSLRRRYFLSRSYPNFTIKPLRGNVPTRVDLARSGAVDAVCIARAGLNRLRVDLSGLDLVDLAIEACPPAPCQGIVAVQTRADDPIAKELACLTDAQAAQAARIELGFLKRIGAGCNYPLGVFTQAEGDKISFKCWLAGKGGPVYHETRGTEQEIINFIDKIHYNTANWTGLT